MTISYKNVVPWGRSYDEYVRMFDLNNQDLKKKILGCGDGPASFNCTCNQKDGDVISIDLVYSLTKEEIEQRINETYADVLSQTRKNKDKFVWDTIHSADDLGRIRMDAMRLFLGSYEQGKEENKYIDCSLPCLPFEDNSFDIALCSHFLFLYTENLSYDFHVGAIKEMLRFAKEVRIFPLLDVNANKSPYVEKIINDLPAYRIDIYKVNYEFQRGGNQLMRVVKEAI